MLAEAGASAPSDMFGRDPARLSRKACHKPVCPGNRSARRQACGPTTTHRATASPLGWGGRAVYRHLSDRDNACCLRQYVEEVDAVPSKRVRE